MTVEQLSGGHDRIRPLTPGGPALPAVSAWVARHQLVAFFAIAYALMFGVTFAYVWGVGLPYQLVWFVGVFSPTISAATLSYLMGGLPAVWRLFSGFTRWKVGARWYAAALFLVLFPLAAALVYSLLGNPVPGIVAGTTALGLAGQFVFTMFSGPLSEEAGWRGFALPRLQAKHGALVSSLILGALWAAWHTPLFFESGSAQIGIPAPIYAVLVITLAIMFTWLYNNTQGSLLITALAHFAFNLDGGFVTGTLGLMPMNVFFMTAGPGLGLLVLVVVLVFGPKNLSRRGRITADAQAPAKAA